MDGGEVVHHSAHVPLKASSHLKLLVTRALETKFEAVDQVSWVKGLALDDPFEELASTSRVAGEACPWALNTEIACLVPT